MFVWNCNVSFAVWDRWWCIFSATAIVLCRSVVRAVATGPGIALNAPAKTFLWSKYSGPLTVAAWFNKALSANVLAGTPFV